jgi:protein TonB
MKCITLLLALSTAGLAQQPLCRGTYRQPSVISKEEPDYPFAAWGKGIEGTILLDAVINTAGVPEHIAVTQGIEALNASAIQAVEKWRFHPATCNGKPVPQVTKIDLHYRLRETPARIDLHNQQQDTNPATVERPATETPQQPTQPQPEPAPAPVTTVTATVVSPQPPAQPAPAQQHAQQHAQPTPEQLPALKQQADCKSDYQNPRLQTKTNPHYTPQAMQEGIWGSVTVTLVVNEQGVPKHVTLYQGIDAGLNQKAIEAVRQWRFFPATCAGKPVMAFAQVDVNFNLLRQKTAQQQPEPTPIHQLPNQRPSMMQGADDPEPVSRTLSDGRPTLHEERDPEPIERPQPPPPQPLPEPQPRPEPRLAPRLNLGQGEIAAAVIRRCSAWVRVTNSTAAEYSSRWAWSGSAGRNNWSIVIYNRAGDSVAAYQEHSTQKLADRICDYFDYHRQ